MIKFQECVGSTTSTQSASNFHSWPFYFLRIKKIQTFSSFYLWKFQTMPVSFCSFFPSYLPCFFFLLTISFILFITSRYLFSIIWTKKTQILRRETRNGRSESGKRKRAKSERNRCKEGGFVICGIGLYLWFMGLVYAACALC